jgi:hypothetical protein
MRRIRDAGGESWDVVVGRSSWGAFHALFAAVKGNEVRQVDLSATAQDEAERELAGSSDDELRALLRDARPRDP